MTKEPLPLRDYQKADLTFFFATPRCASLSDPGVGKTPPACVYTYGRFVGDQAKAVWTQPGSILRKNLEEFLRFTPFTDEDVVVLQGTPKQRAAIMARQPRVVLTTAETFATHSAQFPRDYQLFVSDESHLHWKTISSKRTQALVRFMRDRKWMVFMSGTLIHGRLDSVYPFVHLVEPRYYANHQAFVNQHATLDPWDGKIVGWRRNLGKISEILGRYAIRRTRKEVYGPDAIVRQVEWVDMSPRQEARYREYHDNALIELENGKIVESGSPFSMARAILEHPEAVPEYALTEEGKRVRTGWTDLTKGELSGKDEQLLVHVADHQNDGTPFVYYGALQRQLERVHGLLNDRGVPTGLIHGGVPNPKRVAVDEAFRKGELQAIVASPDTAGIGFNWQFWNGKEVDHCIFGSLPPMDTSLAQAEARFCRQTRGTPLRSTILGYRKSLDKRIFELVERKSGEAAAVDPTREVFQLRRRVA